MAEFQPENIDHKKDLGLATDYDKPVSRTVNKEDGSFNVIYKGGITGLRDFYQTLIGVSWGRFLLSVLLFYIVINAIFAGIYVMIGVETLAGATNLKGLDAFLHAYYFSCQTFTTVGYGAIAPTQGATNFVAAFEALVGLLSFALATGLVYGKFSLPKARIQFSHNALISPYQDKEALMFRIVNRRKNLMLDLEVSAVMTLNQVDSNTGKIKRQFSRLDFEIDSLNYFPLPWTLVHAFKDDSPFNTMSIDELIAAKAEIIVQIKGFDETYSQLVYQRHSYTADEILPKRKFVRNFGINEDGDIEVDIAKVNLSEPS